MTKRHPLFPSSRSVCYENLSDCDSSEVPEIAATLEMICALPQKTQALTGGAYLTLHFAKPFSCPFIMMMLTEGTDSAGLA